MRGRVEMQRSQLSPAQAAMRQHFLELLAERGWTVSEAWEQLFEADTDLSPEAVAQYKNSSMTLQMSLDLVENNVGLECESLDGAKRHAFRLIPDGPIDPVVTAIADLANTVTLVTYPLLVRAALKVCREVYVESPFGLIRLELDE